ncbi:tRNA pseudouridine(55) synthase TruB [bacterium]|nr:tRNA pseudouridine(55) synthase TruB [bacterium]
MNGLLVINKPLNYTSMDMIRVMRRVTKIKKIGHAGTLDPLATGVLLVCIGKATKKIELLMGQEKEYVAEVNFSAFSETDDAQGPLNLVEVNSIPTEADIKEGLSKFIGEIEQTPPKYSAIKIKGRPAYELARKGQAVEMKSRKVFIKSIDIISYVWPTLKINVICGKGVYIRSLARNLGEKLGVGGYLSSLERTRIGQYKVEGAIDIDQLKSDNALEVVSDKLISI